MQPCCAARACSGTLSCATHPHNELDDQVFTTRISEKAGLFGTSEDRTLGTSSCGGLRKRKRFAVTKLGAGRGNCDKAWWFDPNNDRDCRVAVHVNVSTLGSIDCQLEVYARPEPKPDLCRR
jgi:hypothetical protein